MNNLRMTIEEINAEVFDDIVESVYSARKLYIMGLRSSAPLAQFLGYYLSFFLDNVQVVTSGVNDVLEQLFHIGPEDVLIGISFPRYSRRTMEGMRYAQGRGAQLVAITDSGATGNPQRRRCRCAPPASFRPATPRATPGSR